jgi:hypothetical protein
MQLRMSDVDNVGKFGDGRRTHAAWNTRVHIAGQLTLSGAS